MITQPVSMPSSTPTDDSFPDTPGDDTEQVPALAFPRQVSETKPSQPQAAWIPDRSVRTRCERVGLERKSARYGTALLAAHNFNKLPQSLLSERRTQQALGPYSDPTGLLVMKKKYI
ncbi:hypothetical protein NDU88_007928 [Pleurodeles waltl]|uniref:Uncharacterized protein n=1 Tax=Pleurodeles waltl TaxID=8319 RepID=A0AAV7P277_PLEWA|nr:hypothetical protein NDU88_007928 [Pleurodeles waltl]